MQWTPFSENVSRISEQQLLFSIEQFFSEKARHALRSTNQNAAVKLLLRTG